MRRHVVVDGSNIATEGRALPSLRQLNDAVMAFIDENPQDVITVVVDATFGHRIDPVEVAEFDAAVENNELVSPPAGAIGRGDAFVLTIANKANATILSNDSFQEFHADFPWLFDEGRLIGGKPVPNIGWVFVARAPVRGPVSRRATREAKKGGRGRSDAQKAPGRPSKLASEPMPVPKTPPPSKRGAKATEAAEGDGARPKVSRRREGAAAAGGVGRRGAGATDGAGAAATTTAAPAPAAASRAEAPSAARQGAINDLLPFLDFVERHPVGSPVEAVIDSYSSHGAYATSGSVHCYLPLRYLGQPAPRSAREVVALGDRQTFVVVSFNPARRGIDLALPGLQPSEVVLLEGDGAPPSAPAKKASRSRKKAASGPEAVELPMAGADGAVMPAPAKRSRKKAAAASVAAEPTPAPVESADAEAPKKAARSRAKKVAEPEVAAEAAPVAPTPVRPAPAPEPAKRSRKKAASEPDGVPRPVEPAAGEGPKKATRSRAKKAAEPTAAPTEPGTDAPDVGPGAAKASAKKAAKKPAPRSVGAARR